MPKKINGGNNLNTEVQIGAQIILTILLKFHGSKLKHSFPHISIKRLS
jgi:hypothetical protein